jgi:hypothetical protein
MKTETFSSQFSANGSNEDSIRSISLNERLALIALIEEGTRRGSSRDHIASDLFHDLWDLVNATVSGSRIDCLRPEEVSKGFRTFEVNAGTGENLGPLNMLYLNKLIPCYYLVYVEVGGPFRRRGLGNRILEYFKDFLVEKSAIGILDNIIPEEEPSYTIYSKQGWKPLKAFIGDGTADPENHFMIYVPLKWQGKQLRDPLLKIVYHLKRKRAAIDMRDNEIMVQRTIGEFKDLYAALLTYFGKEIRAGKATELTQYMFTRFVTKMIAFRRRIATLLGYTGGESIKQIVLDPVVAALPVRSYLPSQMNSKSPLALGNMQLWARLSHTLKRHPTRFIESLPNYARPSLVAWLKERGMASTESLRIGDLLSLGFDPTRLKEIVIDDEKFIFERIHARQIPELKKKKELLRRIELEMPHVRLGNAHLRVNPPLLTIEDTGNAYVLRRKLDGIHWEEAIEETHSAPHLKSLNETMKIDQMIFGTVRMAQQMISEKLRLREEMVADSLTCFVPWDLENDQPRLVIDFTAAYLESLWMA